MADWAEAQRKLNSLRDEARTTPKKEIVYEETLHIILWMSSDENQHLDMIPFIHRAASLGLSARGNRPGDTRAEGENPPENGEDIPWPPES